MAIDRVFTNDEVNDIVTFLSILIPIAGDDTDRIIQYAESLQLSSLDSLISLLMRLIKSADCEEFISTNFPLVFPRNGMNEKQWIQRVVNQLKVIKDRQEVLAHAESGVVNSLRDRVAWVLNNIKDTRNSDRLLALRYWEEFEPELISNGAISFDAFLKLTVYNSIIRERSRIQNQYKLFQADEVIRKRRGTLQEEEREKAVEDKPDIPVIVVYMDESGKSQENLIVGSVWILLNMREIHHSLYRIHKEQLGGKEFHFKSIRESSVRSYYEMVDIFAKHANTANFKALYVQRAGLRRKEVEVIPDLYYHLLVKGLDYEFSTGRAEPPRKLFVYIDSTDSQMDAVMCENLIDRLRQISHNRFDGKLIDVKVQTLDSKSTMFLQIADLVASSLNRLLTSSGEHKNEKDEFAEHFLSKVGIDINNLKEDQIGDTSVLVSI